MAPFTKVPTAQQKLKLLIDFHLTFDISIPRQKKTESIEHTRMRHFTILYSCESQIVQNLPYIGLHT